MVKDFVPHALATSIGKTFKKLGKALSNCFPGGGVDTIANTRPVNGSLDQSRLFEFAEMLGNGRLSQSDFLYQFPANTGIDRNQVLQDRNPGGMSQGFGQLGQFVLLFGEDFGLGETHVLNCMIAIIRLKQVMFQTFFNSSVDKTFRASSNKANIWLFPLALFS